MRKTRWLKAALVSLCLAFSSLVSANTLYEAKSLYRNILVYEHQGIRCMKFGIHDNGRQSCIDVQNPNRLVLEYIKLLLGALYLQPQPESVLIIGLGGGTLPTVLQKIYPQLKIDCVELDPAVTHVAQQYFYFMPASQTRLFNEDGRVFVKRALRRQQRYDLIVLDAFDHLYVPEHLMTKEFLQELKELLTPAGVLVANTYPSRKLYPLESATYAHVFGSFYQLQQRNRILIASKNSLPGSQQLAGNAKLLEEKLKPYGIEKDWLLPLFSSEVDWPSNSRLLTDQYSPANLLINQ
ncbi:spermidine synthase [Candidatus Magnetaquicoccus inordinatus]|uniref:spermidine synthase n=1 Tax=Candidatus Magnetaquicoccus inordinatus TaxID=2496818 RepID=UPI00187D5C1E|nr:fused MFS/spermidine synthase [Candidatus Magnetaquicoccus inordinatus]